MAKNAKGKLNKKSTTRKKSKSSTKRKTSHSKNPSKKRDGNKPNGTTNKKTKGSTRNPLIQSYGLFWKAEDVDWGKQGSRKGKLLGTPKLKGQGSQCADFRDQIGIYILYSNYKLVYVGQTGSKEGSGLFYRLKKHFDDDFRGRWDQFSWFGLRKVNKTKSTKEKHYNLSHSNSGFHPSRTTVLNHIEAILLFATEPSANRQGGRWDSQAREYFQYAEEGLKNTPKVNSEQITEDINSLIYKVSEILKNQNVLIDRKNTEKVAKRNAIKRKT